MIMNPLSLLLATCLFAYSSYSSNLKMQAVCSSEILVSFSHTARHHVPEDTTRIMNIIFLEVHQENFTHSVNDLVGSSLVMYSFFNIVGEA
jgi:hypothetical protein